MSLGKVSREIIDHIMLIGLDRVAKRNAFDSHMIEDLSLALTEYENNPELRCAVIFAHGDHFTAGLDLVELQPKTPHGIFNFEEAQINPWGVGGRHRTKPVVVAVQGICYTAGVELMLNADVVIASEDTIFGQLEVLRGIMPFGGATVRFVQAAGWQKAMPYLLTGKTFDTQKANELNLVSEVVEKGKQLERAIEVAKEICIAAPLAVQALLASAKDGVTLGQTDAFQKMDDYLKPLFESEDAQEGVRAMLERRLPQFKGR
ncbi:crotonase/enoyl-CoA hydratase family protein [Acinetobacter haemolyticus]|uniref:Crotonase/enoyl-CoA hydratase family protein n=1 Tax=Acinetobacter haemolyticus TaxID=29430 RepID=A0A1L6KPH5_ACIHA|nr:crotonase/enoyl-CoA hydratase family protein [Acinetobacter haemolyticus]APR70981.1 enoyl-CoA hydratase [Acinetobacter haemolyticus]NAR18732.1 crotonase/enoyl-CoA hydratase family protein [Acinetobacter haemolyticus]NAR29995.1 crotonase/enoyl-CoA hydratase family protein [Acinetobacter haemolyticus]NAR36554.1 crotonase/enoyl-CoA hydratase family protein [Acinetobacter haemolyticus]NAR47620.1 crotonase/enoyl-CoA hydratase family protein [Acinetobacter haemolyticus]